MSTAFVLTQQQYPPGFLDYIECALWSSQDLDSDEFLDANYDISDFSESALSDLMSEYNEFLEEADPLLSECEASISQVGHDFWLTRNGHGAGFNDHPHLYNGKQNTDALSALAQKYGELNIYVGDDGKLYTAK